MKKKGLKYISVRLQYLRKANSYCKIIKVKKLKIYLSLYSWFIYKQYSYFDVILFFVFGIIFLKVIEYETNCRTCFNLN